MIKRVDIEVNSNQFKFKLLVIIKTVNSASLLKANLSQVLTKKVEKRVLSPLLDVFQSFPSGLLLGFAEDHPPDNDTV